MKFYYRSGNLLLPAATNPREDVKSKKEHDRTMEALERGFKKGTEKFVRKILYIGDDKKN